MRALILALCVFSAACGSSAAVDITNPPPPKPKALDPFLTVRMRNQLDTTTSPGRAHWHIYALLSGPYTNQNGISPQGAISLEDVRLGHTMRCTGAGADSVGQRFLSLLALADTTTEALTADASTATMARAWYDGNQVLPSGWMAIAFPPTDVWDSQQFRNGHGLTDVDPIKWAWDWSAAGTSTLYERAAADTTGCNHF